MKKLRIHKPKVSYREFCLFQNSWIDLWTTEDEQDLIKSMNPELQSKLLKVVTDDNGNEETTVIWSK